MFTAFFAFFLGLLVAWSLPKPAWVDSLVVKVKELFRKVFTPK